MQSEPLNFPEAVNFEENVYTIICSHDMQKHFFQDFKDILKRSFQKI